MKATMYIKQTGPKGEFVEIDIKVKDRGGKAFLLPHEIWVKTLNTWERHIVAQKGTRQ